MLPSDKAPRVMPYAPSDPPELRKAIRACLNSEMTTVQACKFFNVAKSTLDGRLRAAKDSMLALDVEFHWDPVNMQQAIKACLRGEMAQSAAAKVFQVPRATLRSRLAKAKALKLSPDEVPVQHFMHPLKVSKNKARERVPDRTSTQGSDTSLNQRRTPVLSKDELESKMNNVMEESFSSEKTPERNQQHAADRTIDTAPDLVPIQELRARNVLTKDKDGGSNEHMLRQLIPERIQTYLTSSTAGVIKNSESYSVPGGPNHVPDHRNRNPSSYPIPLPVHELSMATLFNEAIKADLPRPMSRRSFGPEGSLSPADTARSRWNASSPNSITDGHTQNCNRIPSRSLSPVPNRVQNHNANGILETSTNGVSYRDRECVSLQDFGTAKVCNDTNKLEAPRPISGQSFGSGGSLSPTNTAGSRTNSSSPNSIVDGHPHHASSVQRRTLNGPPGTAQNCIPNGIPESVPSGVPGRDPGRVTPQDRSMENVLSNQGTDTARSIMRHSSPPDNSQRKTIYSASGLNASLPSGNREPHPEQKGMRRITNRATNYVPYRVPDRVPDNKFLHHVPRQVFPELSETRQPNPRHTTAENGSPTLSKAGGTPFTATASPTDTVTSQYKGHSGGPNRVPNRVPGQAPNNEVPRHEPERIPVQAFSMSNIYTNTGATVMTHSVGRVSSADRIPYGRPASVSPSLQECNMNRTTPDKADPMAGPTLPESAPSHAPPEDVNKFQLTHTEEAEMINMIVSMSSRLYGMDIEDIRRIACEYIETLERHKPSPGTYYINKAGAQWAINLAKRNPQLLALDHNYAAESTERALMGAFFRKLRAICKRRQIPPGRIYNTEAYAINLTQRAEITEMRGKQLRVVYSKAKSYASFQVCVNGEGEFMPPKLIFPSKQPSAPLVLPPKCTAEFKDSGLITRKIFMKWFDDFVDFTQPTKETPVLLLLDARFGYLRSLEFFINAKRRHVEILSFPPNSANILQPLDVSFFAPMRSYYIKALQEFSKLRNVDLLGTASTQWNSITLENMAPSLFTASYMRAATKQTGMDGFRNTGICPFDPRQSILDTPDVTARSHASPEFIQNALAQTGSSLLARPIDDGDTDEGFEGAIAAFIAERFK